MTLSFSKQNIEERNFKQKIWHSLIEGLTPNQYGEVLMEWGLDADEIKAHAPKKHTIRKDDKNRWKKGSKIHLVQDNRTPNRFQFAPTIPCTGIELINIKWYGDEKQYVAVRICNQSIYNGPKWANELSNLKELSENDGFDTVKDFLEYFNQDFEGKIIHWTDHRYSNDAVIYTPSTSLSKEGRRDERYDIDIIDNVIYDRGLRIID